MSIGAPSPRPAARALSFLRAACVLGAMLALPGCADRDGPVFGNWQGRQPTGGELDPHFVDLVLHGAPGATEGEYDFKVLITDPTLSGIGNHTVIWGDRWTLTRVGTAPPVLRLHDLPDGEISSYALMADGVLLPATRAGAPDLSPASLHDALQPVARDSWGYGRL